MIFDGTIANRIIEGYSRIRQFILNLVALVEYICNVIALAGIVEEEWPFDFSGFFQFFSDVAAI